MQAVIQIDHTGLALMKITGINVDSTNDVEEISPEVICKYNRLLVDIQSELKVNGKLSAEMTDEFTEMLRVVQNYRRNAIKVLINDGIPLSRVARIMDCTLGYVCSVYRQLQNEAK